MHLPVSLGRAVCTANRRCHADRHVISCPAYLRSGHADQHRRFELHRDVDVTGISGTGVVAEGIAFTDGTAVIRWTAGEHQSTVVWPDVASVEAIHGHGGATRIVWIDQ